MPSGLLERDRSQVGRRTRDAEGEKDEGWTLNERSADRAERMLVGEGRSLKGPGCVEVCTQAAVGDWEGLCKRR